MPTLLKKDGFRIFFYANDHFSRHVHCIGHGGEVKIILNSLELVHNFAMKPKDLKRALKIVEVNRLSFMNQWDEFFEK